MRPALPPRPNAPLPEQKAALGVTA